MFAPEALSAAPPSSTYCSIFLLHQTQKRKPNDEKAVEKYSFLLDRSSCRTTIVTSEAVAQLHEQYLGLGDGAVEHEAHLIHLVL